MAWKAILRRHFTSKTQYEGIGWEPVWITGKSTSNPRKFILLGTPVEEAGMIDNSEPYGHMGCKTLLSFVITL